MNYHKIYFFSFMLLFCECSIIMFLAEPVCWNWQTRRTQNPLLETACGFDPRHRHHEGAHSEESEWAPFLNCITLARLLYYCGLLSYSLLLSVRCCVWFRWRGAVPHERRGTVAGRRKRSPGKPGNSCGLPDFFCIRRHGTADNSGRFDTVGQSAGFP